MTQLLLIDPKTRVYVQYNGKKRVATWTSEQDISTQDVEYLRTHKEDKPEPEVA